MIAEDIGRHCMLSKCGGHWTATLTESLTYDSAIYYLQKGLEAKVPLAAFAMGLYYSEGRGSFPKDEKLSKKYMKMAADWGFKPAIDIMNEYKKQKRRSWLFSFGKASTETATDVIGDSIGDKIVNYFSKLF